MSYTLLIGIIGGIILIIGSALKDNDVIPIKSLKNWFLAIGSFTLLIYAIFNYLNEGSIFFIILQLLIVLCSILMMLNTSDKINIPIISISGILLVLWAFFLFENYNTLIFITGLCILGLGYTFKSNTLKRIFSLALGSFLIALFSYMENNYIFFLLNVFFFIFSGYYLIKLIKKLKSNF